MGFPLATSVLFWLLDSQVFDASVESVDIPALVTHLNLSLAEFHQFRTTLNHILSPITMVIVLITIVTGANLNLNQLITGGASHCNHHALLRLHGLHPQV